MENIKMQRYPAYKDSGVEWIGSMPAHWEPKPGFTVIEERKEKNIGLKENKVLSLSYGNVIVKSEDKLTGLVPESFETYQLVYPGDIIVRPTDLQNDKTSLRTGLARDKGIITSAYINLKMKNGYSTGFFHYFLHSIDVTKVIYGLGSGLRQNLDFGDFKRFVFLVPPITEQTRIAHFLDQKTAQIDQAIAQKERLIELLKERRQILIQKAVTRGLNQNVRMKDSGVEWIGEIPEHWEVKRIKHVSSQIVDGAHFTPTYVDEGIPFLRVTDLSNPMQESIDWGNVKYIPLNEHKELIKRAKPQKGDILLSKNGTIGLTKVVEWDEEFSFFVSLCLIKPLPTINPQYFCLFFNSPLVDRQITYGSSRTSVTNLHLEKIKELILILPPVKEQSDIVEDMNRITAKFDKGLKTTLSQIDKLKEYKATLINSAVTGKIKV